MLEVQTTGDVAIDIQQCPTKAESFHVKLMASPERLAATNDLSSGDFPLERVELRKLKSAIFAPLWSAHAGTLTNPVGLIPATLMEEQEELCRRNRAEPLRRVPKQFRSRAGVA